MFSTGIVKNYVVWVHGEAMYVFASGNPAESVFLVPQKRGVKQRLKSPTTEKTFLTPGV